MPFKILNEKFKLKRIRSDPNLVGQHGLPIKYSELESKYLTETLRKSFADTKQKQKTCFPFIQTHFGSKQNKIENNYLKTDKTENDKMSINENYKADANLANDRGGSNENGKGGTRLENGVKDSHSKGSIRATSRLKAGNFKETYIFFKKPLKRFKIASTKEKEKKAYKNSCPFKSPV